MKKLAGSTGAELLGQWAAHALTLPAAESPLRGNPGKCFTLGRGDRVASLLVSAASPPLSCAIRAGTPLFLPSGANVCGSNLAEPYREVTETEQRECATEFFSVPALVAIELTVNGGSAVNIRNDRFELVSRQTAAVFPEANAVGADPGPATLVAAGYAVTTRGRLRPGRYDVTVAFVFASGSRVAVAFTLDVVAGRDA